ncbi:MAG: asparaginase [Alysiella sp.]|uniref:asparaginase n=1 Tax=Alysiella sp. TaxID=1872483 RepID=UPI0026DD26E2|nr:asparaginase [Alysiella sp.]MDO4434130.1 asparaginase [Alysiella sp.]
MKKIFVLYTGGTIGMVESSEGLRPDTAIANMALAPFSGSLHFDWYICQPLIDSSAVTPQHWAQWLVILQEKLPDYDGVLVLHGTDTLAYTANFLALTLNCVGKTVVLTGSQKPFGRPDSDAPLNLQTAVSALKQDYHGVLLAFNGKLFPAIGSSKYSTESDNGFVNTHFGYVVAESKLPENPNMLSGSLLRHFNPNIRTAALYLTPSFGVQTATQILQAGQLNVAILMSYGHGNAPNDVDFLNAAHNFIQQGKILLNISQVAQGCVAAVYAQGNALRQIGVINGGKCTIETAIPLMMLAAENQWTNSELETELRRLKLI